MLTVQDCEAPREAVQPLTEIVNGPLKLGLIDWDEVLTFVRMTGRGELVAPAIVAVPKSSNVVEAVTSVVLGPFMATGKVIAPPLIDIESEPENAPICPPGVNETLMEQLC